MEIKGRRIKKRYIALAIAAVLIIPRCVQMNMEESALKEKLAAGGFDSETEMENIVGSGFATKLEFENFIRKTPIPSEDGEATVRCAALASFWESKDLTAKSALGELVPASISSVLNSDLLYDYQVGKTTNKILTSRRDYLREEFEKVFEREGYASQLKDEYLSCHKKFGDYIKEKCGISGDCDSSAAQADWNFLLNKCVINSESVSACTETDARRGDGAGGYDLFFEDRVEMYIFDPIVIPEDDRKDSKIVATDITYSQDAGSSGVLLGINTAEGCKLRSLFTLSEDQSSVYERALEVEGSCSDRQRSINKLRLQIQERDGPTKKKIMRLE